MIYTIFGWMDESYIGVSGSIFGFAFLILILVLIYASLEKRHKELGKYLFIILTILFLYSHHNLMDELETIEIPFDTRFSCNYFCRNIPSSEMYSMEYDELLSQYKCMCLNSDGEIIIEKTGNFTINHLINTNSCSDGTKHNFCSKTTTMFCNNGVLEYNALTCGCPDTHTKVRDKCIEK